MKTISAIKNILNTNRTIPFGESLVLKGLLTHRELTEALGEQRNNGGRLGEVLLKLKILSDETVTGALAEHLNVDHVLFEDFSGIDKDFSRTLSEDIAKRFCVIAIETSDNEAVVAMADPQDVIAIDTVSLALKSDLKVLLASQHQIEQATDLVYHGSDAEERSLRELVDLHVDTEQAQQTSDRAEADITDEAAASKAPVIQFVNLLLSHAVKSRASDIHLEPKEKTMSIRMRIDGHLRQMIPPPGKMQAAVLTRIKILSEMDIAERRLPQDGRLKIKASGRDIDVRVSSIPTIYGQKIVMRILDSAAVDHNLDRLGFGPDRLEEFKKYLSLPNGIVIVTGPTGSGKSTTLYSALNYLNDPAKNITTVEDPVEYRLNDINQVQVKPEIGLNFASCLRSILRQDPDIVLIGEIRDKETVEIAIKASLTGHLVLSTFHTNDAPSALSRLIYMGIKPYLLASTLRLVVAQRLVRKICHHCMEETTPSESQIVRLGIDQAAAKKITFYKGKGCNLCGSTGYYGRLPIFEFLAIDEDMRKELLAGANESKIRKLSRRKGYEGLLGSGLKNIAKGLTTAEEVLRITLADNLSL